MALRALISPNCEAAGPQPLPAKTKGRGRNHSPLLDLQTRTHFTCFRFVELLACDGRCRFCRRSGRCAAYLFFRFEPLLDILPLLPPALNIDLIRSASDSIFYFLTFQHWRPP